MSDRVGRMVAGMDMPAEDKGRLDALNGLGQFDTPEMRAVRHIRRDVNLRVWVDRRRVREKDVDATGDVPEVPVQFAVETLLKRPAALDIRPPFT